PPRAPALARAREASLRARARAAPLRRVSEMAIAAALPASGGGGRGGAPRAFGGGPQPALFGAADARDRARGRGRSLRERGALEASARAPAAKRASHRPGHRAHVPLPLASQGRRGDRPGGLGPGAPVGPGSDYTV